MTQTKVACDSDRLGSGMRAVGPGRDLAAANGGRTCEGASESLSQDGPRPGRFKVQSNIRRPPAKSGPPVRRAGGGTGVIG